MGQKWQKNTKMCKKRAFADRISVKVALSKGENCLHEHPPIETGKLLRCWTTWWFGVWRTENVVGGKSNDSIPRLFDFFSPNPTEWSWLTGWNRCGGGVEGVGTEVGFGVSNMLFPKARKTREHAAHELCRTEPHFHFVRYNQFRVSKAFLRTKRWDLSATLWVAL
jgi:hypothetical protein